MKKHVYYASEMEELKEEMIQMLSNVSRQIISFDDVDVDMTVKGAANALCLEGRGEGADRLRQSIDEAVAQAEAVAPMFDVFSASRVMVYFCSSEQHLFLMSELDALFAFKQKFGPDAAFMWGIGTAACVGKDSCEVRMLLVDLQEKK